MKTLFKLFALLPATLLMACEKDLPTYNGTNNIYFRNAVQISSSDVRTDSSFFSFALYTAALQDTVLKIPIMTMGMPSSQDRTYKLTIPDSSTAIAGVDYELVSGAPAIRGGYTTDSVFIRVKRTAEMRDTTKLLILQLEQNEHFNVDMKDFVYNTLTGQKMSYIRHRLYLSDILRQPRYWIPSHFGVFSREKLYLMVDILGIAANRFDGTVSVGDANYYGRKMQRYLNQQKLEGNTVYEANGTPMAMGSSVQ